MTAEVAVTFEMYGPRSSRTVPVAGVVAKAGGLVVVGAEMLPAESMALTT